MTKSKSFNPDKKPFIEPVHIEATTIGDAWFQCIYNIFDKGYEYKIDHGSFEEQSRLEYDFVTVRMKTPGVKPLAVQMPESMSIPPPTTEEDIEEYFVEYLMSDMKQPNEDYTYAERIVNPKYVMKGSMLEQHVKDVKSDKEYEFASNVNQIDEVIKMYKDKGHGTNQAVIEIAMPTDIKLVDPPCLRIIDTRIRYDKLHFMIYFRSWDLWGGFPVNLGGLQLMKEYMAEEIGVGDGEIIAASKGMHIYDHVVDAAKIRAYKGD